jgi:phosphate-selective porin
MNRKILTALTALLSLFLTASAAKPDITSAPATKTEQSNILTASPSKYKTLSVETGIAWCPTIQIEYTKTENGSIELGTASANDMEVKHLWSGNDLMATIRTQVNDKHKFVFVTIPGAKFRDMIMTKQPGLTNDFFIAHAAKQKPVQSASASGTPSNQGKSGT